ncbi:MAG TPA: GntR family transcriptional regulator [Vicinamibacterales bacterium]|nr:GntR family transcriptional regulator [Vicinamibacterales bacterium]
MLPFSLVFKPGLSVHEQVVYAVKKACVSGRLRPGDPFPSVRTLSQELRINPNTAHKVVATLVGDGLLEVRPGIGTTIARAPAASRAQRRALLHEEVERLVVEARKLSVDLDEVTEAVRDQWKRLDRG